MKYNFLALCVLLLALCAFAAERRHHSLKHRRHHMRQALSGDFTVTAADASAAPITFKGTVDLTSNSKGIVVGGEVPAEVSALLAEGVLDYLQVDDCSFGSDAKSLDFNVGTEGKKFNVKFVQSDEEGWASRGQTEVQVPAKEGEEPVKGGNGGWASRGVTQVQAPAKQQQEKPKGGRGSLPPVRFQGDDANKACLARKEQGGVQLAQAQSAETVHQVQAPAKQAQETIKGGRGSLPPSDDTIEVAAPAKQRAEKKVGGRGSLPPPDRRNRRHRRRHF